MKERPILFSAPMVRAILDGTKTQTRRVVKHRFAENNFSEGVPLCPYGKPGDRLWVREAWSFSYCGGQDDGDLVSDDFSVSYRAGGDEKHIHREYTDRNLFKLYDSQRGDWRPSIHMPRWASRITLEIVSVRVERLTQITEEDAKAEGYDGSTVVPGHDVLNCRAWYEGLWDTINGAGSFRTNPWVWVVEFKRVTK